MSSVSFDIPGSLSNASPKILKCGDNEIKCEETFCEFEMTVASCEIV